MISATMIAHSVNTASLNREEIATMKVVMPRYILAEFNTHRMFSRNSASSRAIPSRKMLEMIRTNPFIPIAWQREHTGMQGQHYFTDELEIESLRRDWILSSYDAVNKAEYLMTLGVTKQICNRLLEPFMWHTVLVTATEWENFFALRCPQYEVKDDALTPAKIFRSRKDCITYWGELSKFTNQDWLYHNKGQAEIHMMALAEAMWDCYNESTPKELKAGEWHIPYGDQIANADLFFLEGNKTPINLNLEESIDLLKRKIAVARCARISYQTLDEVPKTDYAADIKLHDRLAAFGHWSPFEHVAQAMGTAQYATNVKVDISKLDYNKTYLSAEQAIADVKAATEQGWSGNFRGFTQYRKTFSNENITK